MQSTLLRLRLQRYWVDRGMEPLMFGLMRFRGEEQRRWRTHYCGTCKTIGKQYGQRARLLLNHDAVFLAELLTTLGGQDSGAWGPAYESWNCMRLPENGKMPEVLRYVAAATILLSEYRLDDHQTDVGGRGWRWAKRVMSRTFRSARRDLRDFGFDLKKSDEILARQNAAEEDTANPDGFAAPTSEATALVFSEGGRVAGLPEHGEMLHAAGYLFGQVIYWLDAWEDFERDARKGAFNGLRAGGLGREWAAPRIREDVEKLAAILPAEFGMRLRANVDSRLGLSLRVLHTCHAQARRTVRERWREAVVKARGWQTPAWKIAAVAAVAFLFPAHARMAKSSHECLSLALNLMAIGGLLASAQGPVGPAGPVSPPPLQPATGGGGGGTSKGSGCRDACSACGWACECCEACEVCGSCC